MNPRFTHLARATTREQPGASDSTPPAPSTAACAARCAALLLLLVPAAAAPTNSRPAAHDHLDRLAAALQGERIAERDLVLADCPGDLEALTPSGRVLQVLESRLHRWDEYALDDGALCVRLVEPELGPLTREQAHVLLSASSLLWRREPALEPAAAAAEPHAIRGDLPAIEPPAPRFAAAAPTEHSRVGYATRPGSVASVEAPGTEAEEAGEPAEPLSDAPDRLQTLVQPSVIGADERVEVQNTGQVPYQQVAYVEVAWAGHGAGRATAFLVGPHMALTNAHVVWHKKARALPGSGALQPARRGSGNPTGPFGARQASRFAVNNAWTQSFQPQFDYGAVFFDRPFDAIRSFVPIFLNVAPPPGTKLEVPGFPEVVRGQSTSVMFTHTDDLLAVQGRLLRHRVDTSRGNSGGPVLVEVNGQKRAIAVHSSGDPSPPSVSNIGARFVSESEALLVEWLRWEPQRRQGLDLTLQGVDTGECPQIDAYATVENNLGDPVGGLSATNFRLWENGRERRPWVAQAESFEGQRNFALVLDSSGSLGSAGVAAEKAAARTFVARLRPTDRVAVYLFDSTVRKLLDFSTNRAAALAAIDQLTAQGLTSLYDAIVDAANDLQSQGGQKAIVLMTDGADTSSRRTISDAAAAARNASAPVFAAGFGSASDSVLQNIANATGGAYFRSPSTAQLEEMLRLIGEAINNAYIISWLTDFTNDDTLDVEIEVRDGDEADLEQGLIQLRGTRCERKGSGCNVTVQSPNGGETWLKGQQQTIRWNTSGPSCGQRVSVGLFDGSRLRLLPDEPNDGVMQLDPSFLPVGSAYRTVVIDLGTGQLDKSDGDFAIEAPFSPFPCPQDALTLCLGNSRFMAHVIYRAPDGANGYGQRRAITSDTGAFWFFDQANLELVVKVLDGRPFNGFFWLFYAALSDVEYTLYVTDTQTGVTRAYFNPQGTQASRADIHYFTPARPDSEAAPLELAPDGARPWLDTDQGWQAAGAAVLHTQLAGGNDGGVNSQQYLGLDSIYHNEVADDFVVPAGKSWTVDRIEVNGFYGDAGQNVPRGPASSVSVRFYRDSGGFPGAIECGALSLRPTTGLADGRFVLQLPQACRFDSGRYWVSVQSNQSFADAGSWFWRTRPQVVGQPAVFRNPGGFFQPPCPSWARIDQCTNGFGRWDTVFSVSGVETSTGGNCQATVTSLCLNQGRFRVSVQYRTGQGATGNGQAVALTGDTGYFTFFDAANVEIVLKVLDGRALNNHFWVFYGALSDVEYTVTVEDTQTGKRKTYSNPQGNLASVGDSSALPAN